jgi:diamine N-acetyltransferase
MSGSAGGAGAGGGPDARSRVTLREIDARTVRAICALSVREDQKKFVAPNAVSIAEAHFSGHAWFRAVYADETPVGFVMLEDRPEVPDYFLWRFMIDARYQGLGFGARAIALLLDHVRTRPNAAALGTSVVPGEGSPGPFYEKLGFRFTGEYDEGEALMKLVL